MLALRLFGYSAIALGIIGVVVSFVESFIYIVPAMTLLVSGVVFLAFDAILLKLDQIRDALTVKNMNTADIRPNSAPTPQNVIATTNGIELRQEGSKMVARGLVFNSIGEFRSWADSQ